MSEQTFFITTTIPYVNAKPHIGMALEYVQTDTFARFHRLSGDDTYALTGADENSLKNVQAAESEGVPTRELVDRYSRRFEEVARALGFEFDQFIRTAVDPRHKAGAQKLWRAVRDNGDIYKKAYSGLYCVGCEQFYDESELVNGLCPEHLTTPDLVQEENYFFRLSRYQERLRDLIASGGLTIIPETRKNEVLSFITRGLEDFSISRSQERARGWGIPVPDDTSQVMYVWFDALTNYITALDYAADGPLYRTYWGGDQTRVHALGKNVIKFHAIYWPAMLMSAGLPLPHLEFVHGFMTIEGMKISKSLGNVIDPEDLIRDYGVDATRYYLLRAVNPTGDSNFSIEGLEARYNADLANDLGNLINRTISMIGRYRAGTVPAPGANTELEGSLQTVAGRVPEAVRAAMTAYDPQSALDAIWALVTRANKYAEESAPWTLARAEKAGDEAARLRLDTALYTLAEAARLIGALLEPLLPDTSRRIREQLGDDSEPVGLWEERLEYGKLEAGRRVDKATPLFPRLDARRLETA
jgi:methionyl-tRNA synthetase